MGYSPSRLSAAGDICDRFDLRWLAGIGTHKLIARFTLAGAIAARCPNKWHSIIGDPA
jgi:hypothetical protein